MANNNLYIRNKETGETVLLAISDGNGWVTFCNDIDLDTWFDRRDIAASYGNCEGETQLELITKKDPPEVT